VHRRIETPYAHFGVAVIYMLFVAFLSTWVGLAAIVGAFAAGAVTRDGFDPGTGVDLRSQRHAAPRAVVATRGDLNPGAPGGSVSLSPSAAR
jgi:hypothetical protein